MALTGKKEAIDSIINKMPVYPLPNYAFHNQKDLTFDNKAKDWGLGVPSLSNGAAYGDLDNDGDLDLVVNNVNMQAFVYQNHTNEIDQIISREGQRQTKCSCAYYNNQDVLFEHVGKDKRKKGT